MIVHETCVNCGKQANWFKSKTVHTDQFDFYKCPSCELEFCHASDQQLHDFYADYVDFRAAADVLKINAQNNLDKMLTHVHSKQSPCLDFGCGTDEFRKIALETGWPNWNSYDPFLKNDPSVLLQNHYQCVTLWGVLEHTDQPITLLKTVNELMTEGGIVFITTINIDSAIPFQYKPPEHLTYWNRKSISGLLAETGFEFIGFEDYRMTQRSDIYAKIILRTVPETYKSLINISGLPEYVDVPTNECFVIAQKIRG